MRTLVAKMFRVNPITFAEDIDDLLNGLKLRIFRFGKWITLIVVVVNALMLILGESRFIEDWSVLDRLRYEWKAVRWWIEREIIG